MSADLLYAVYRDTDVGTHFVKRFGTLEEANLFAARWQAKEDERYRSVNSKRPKNKQISREAFDYFSVRKVEVA